MQENYLLVQRGFRVLVASMSQYIGMKMVRRYGDDWWNEVLRTVWNPQDLPACGEYGELVDSLDILNCLHLLDFKWNELYRDELNRNCRTWAIELKGIRNIVAHIGQQDLEQHMAERALDTMVLLCQELDEEGAIELRSVYREIRDRAHSRPEAQPFSGLAQPEAASLHGVIAEGGLLQLVGTEMVQRTTMTRKVTYGGKTVVYPVYRVRLDALYYNDQNDRIATWISRYEAENGETSLAELDKEIYNHIIENFIVESNPEKIRGTQTNISLFGQREPGVALADGRVVDGNRRFTCLRRIQRENPKPVYFETVIMEMDIREDKKKIKLLELAIQHGEEGKVPYDLIDYAIGTYRDVVQTGLLTVEEYADSTNEPVAEVKKRIEVAEIVNEFLNFVRLPGQYYAAREYQVYSLFQEMMAPLKKLDSDEKAQLKQIAFCNAMMKAIPDQRKFIRDIKTLIKSEAYTDYFAEQKKLCEELIAKYAQAQVHTKADADQFATENSGVAEALQMTLEKALLRARSVQLRNKPSENVEKSIGLLMDIDPRLFGRLDEEEKETLKAELDELKKIVTKFQRQLSK